MMEDIVYAANISEVFSRHNLDDQYRTYIAPISMYVKSLMNKRNRLLSLDK